MSDLISKEKTRYDIAMLIMNNNSLIDTWLANCIDDVIDEQPTIEVAPRWIPCSERLPEEQKKSYWVCTDSGYQCECRWTNINHFWTQPTTDWHWHPMDVPQYTRIVAWMPLPEPYKMDEVEE